jgi:flavin reductase (DIM6/NTAB) family NADH-FMN oxidoreductase RutF
MFFDFATLSGGHQGKLMTSTIVPRPIAWVVTQDPEGQVNAAPFSFFNMFSSHPPLIAIGINGPKPGGGSKDTWRNIHQSREFAVNLVSFETAPAMNVTASNYPADIDELKAAGLTTRPSVKISTPGIAESPVTMECEVHSLVDLAADHILVIGRVVAMHVRDDAVLDRETCAIDTHKLDLVARVRNPSWYCRTRDEFEIKRL